MPTVAVSFGYNRGIPPNATAAWGARWIISRDCVEQLHDRMGCGGNEAEYPALLGYLNKVVKSKASKEAERLLKKGGKDGLSQRDDKEVVLFEDERIIVKANPQASHGYLYVIAYFKPTDGQEREEQKA